MGDVGNLLRGAYQGDEHRKVVPPMTVPRRFDFPPLPLGPAETLRSRNSFVRDDGSPLNYTL